MRCTVSSHVLLASMLGLVWIVSGTPEVRAWPPNGVPAGRAQVQPPGQTADVRATSMPDGAGGIYLAWPSYDVASSGWRIVAQRLSATGVPWPGWPADGRAVGLPRDGAAAPLLVSDGTDGVFVFWSDWDDARGTYELAAQHVDATGSLVFPWPASGLLLGIEVHPGEASVVPDGAEGAFIAWLYRGPGALLAVRALRMNQWGSVASGWTAEGLTLSTTSHEDPPAAASDLDGYAYVAWTDHRGADVDIYLSRVSMSGSLADGWPQRGRRICGATADQSWPACVADGASGVVVVWYDARRGPWEPYAVRITSAGGRPAGWPADGRPACEDPGAIASDITIEPDASGGVYVAWSDYRAGGNDLDVYAQHVTGSGAIAFGWPAQGRAVAPQPNEQQAPALVADGSSLVVAWEDHRSVVPDIYLLRLDPSSGDPAAGWPPAGVGACTQAAEQWKPTLVSDGDGGAIAAWLDDRDQSADYVDIYAARLDPSGSPPTDVHVAAPPAGLRSGLLAWPNPAHDVVRLVLLSAPGWSVHASVYDAAGRLVRRLPAAAAIAPFTTLSWDGRDGDGAPLPGGTYFVRVQTREGVRQTKVVLAPTSLR